MTLVAHSDLPSFRQLQDEGHDLLTAERARKQDIRELHIGFLNMMPDAALQATERQFIRLVGSCNRIAQFYVYPFSLQELDRSAPTREYVDRYYSHFDDLRAQGLDALIITGANVANPNLKEEPFWEPLIEVAEWAHDNVASTLCSCLATHSLVKHFYGIDRQPLGGKRWGVFSHRRSVSAHPLIRDINTRFDVPHSRYNEISRQQLEAAGLHVLVESDEGGVHLAVSPDQARVVFFQGHPEYDRNSLLKEYKREVHRYADGLRDAVPPYPQHYFSPAAHKLIDAVQDDPDQLIRVIENDVEAHLNNTWGDTAKSIVNNWLGMVYQLTNLNRTEQYMPGVDRDDPLGLKSESD